MAAEPHGRRAVAPRVDMYLAQDFFGVRERLARADVPGRLVVPRSMVKLRRLVLRFSADEDALLANRACDSGAPAAASFVASALTRSSSSDWTLTIEKRSSSAPFARCERTRNRPKE